MRTVSPVFVLVVALSLVAVTAYAQWQPTAAPVCTAQNDQLSPAMIPDGAGGAIMTWYDFRADAAHADIYAQRVNAFGVPQWTANGVAICTAVDHQAAPVIVPDGGTGAIIAWYDTRNGVDTDIYAQRVNASGVPQWAANGVALCTATGNQIFHDIASDGAGGAIVVWEDHRGSGAVGDIYARRINAAGVPQWAANGVVICAATGDQLSPHIVSDGAGGAIMAWVDTRLGGFDIAAQRVNAAGAPQWAADGIPICTAIGNQESLALIPDGANGAVIVWEDGRSLFTDDIYAQRVNGAGSPLWPLDGTAVCAATDTQEFPAIATDGAGGAIITWDDYRSGPTADIYAQRVGADGSSQWALGGIAVCTATNYQTNPLITSDGTGGAVIVWRDTRSFFTTDAYVQRVNAFGVMQWTPDGNQATEYPANISVGSLIWDGSAALAAFFDYRNGAADIYAQRVEGRFGFWGHPEPVVTSVADVPKDQGGHVAVNWTASSRDVNSPRTIGYYTVWRAVSALPVGPSAAAVVKDIRWVGPGTRGPVFALASPASDYYWELVGTQSAHGFAGYSFSAPTRADSVAGNSATERFMVSAHDDGDDYVAFVSNNLTGHSVDNLAPAAPQLLTISQFGVSAMLTWKPVGDPDLAHYTLYRKSSAGVTPIPANFFSDESLTSHVDVGNAAAGYHYIVVAVDAHGNRSAPSNEVSLNGSTGVNGAAPPLALVVDANAPNPFAGSSRFRVGLPRDGDVRVSVYDVAGRLVRDAHVAGVKGWQMITLDGRDDAGHALASGVYFYRVSAAGRTITHKMVVAR